MTNRYPGTCARCNTKVAAGAGTATKTARGTWTVMHTTCGTGTGPALPARGWSNASRARSTWRADYLDSSDYAFAGDEDLDQY